jgi:microcompartment protein CcmK/EutM
MNKSHKLYEIKAYNSFGGGIGTYYVVSTGVNKAKAAVKEADKIIKRAVVVDEHQVIVAE